jgi:hypothetical protein
MNAFAETLAKNGISTNSALTGSQRQKTGTKMADLQDKIRKCKGSILILYGIEVNR